VGYWIPADAGMTESARPDPYVYTFPHLWPLENHGYSRPIH
jgi:hypothetical protein